MKYYLAYGSNLNKEQMKYRCPGAEPVGAALIEDYELVFRRGYLTIEPKEGSSVPVGIWKVSAENEKALDRYEGYPKFYYKATFDIGMAYIMSDGFAIQPPTQTYLHTVINGYADFGLDLKPLEDAYYRSYYQSRPEK